MRGSAKSTGVGRQKDHAEPTSRQRSMARAVANGAVEALQAAIQSALFSSGDVKASARSTPETGWYLCDGSTKNRTTDADLFAAIGTTFGVGNGSTTFNLPDCRGRAIVGVGTGSGLTTRALGVAFGEENVTLSVATIPAHEHSISTSNDHAHTTHANRSTDTQALGSFNRLTNLIDAPNGDVSAATSSSGAHAHGGQTGSAGSTAAHSNVQPSVALNVFIKR
jgi:microcystin-dependent protein